ncbi:hypothetical protein TESG_07031 [Trichophyton tonsurans CBS 112818]|uniref:Jacalin-type lectin domain-containing protein n=1 Tax=Trichophyton tonsurans (strain CBS 112818) TaxID=647933 RepID=F2S803_TRIT1|nr:hypothetical protein TESG_07031 [Trichophyton tonsurans CBS 112818]
MERLRPPSQLYLFLEYSIQIYLGITLSGATSDLKIENHNLFYLTKSPDFLDLLIIFIPIFIPLPTQHKHFIDIYCTPSRVKEARRIDHEPIELLLYYLRTQGTFTSGVGRHSDPYTIDWIAPSDSASRWDDPGYTPSSSDRIPVMRQGADCGLHGFVMHDLCWQLLQKFYEPDDVPVARLLDVCRSLPLAILGSCAFWGHDYGGLITLDTKDHYPWEDRAENEFNSSLTYAKGNPYDVAEIPELLTLSYNSSPSPGISQPHLERETKSDCFAIFPWEIIEEISANLLVSDILALIRSSRTFGPILSSQTFWASRFEPGKDRAFLFEKRNCKEARDWAKLYQLTKRSAGPPGLKNRRRIWDLIQCLAPYLESSLDKTPRHSSTSSARNGMCEVAGDILVESVSGFPDTFYQGCLLFDKQRTTIPSNLLRVGISVAEDSITGIRLVSSAQEDICLGYIIKCKEVVIETTSLCGFMLGVDSRGIRSIRVIHGDGNESDWVGSPADTPITGRLMELGDINSLEVGVDGYKIISIAAASPHSIPPKMPLPELCLNDQSFTGQDPLTAGYQPLAWINFGGPKGVYLKHITGVCVTGPGNICTIEFEYDIDLPVEIRKLGRRKVTNFSIMNRFKIDGPGGEYITNIDASIIRVEGKKVYPFYRWGKLFSFKITTNHGRSAHFTTRDSTVDPPTMTPLSVEPGTMVTGLYGAQHPEQGLISLGVISEVATMGKRKREPEHSGPVKRILLDNGKTVPKS